MLDDLLRGAIADAEARAAHVPLREIEARALDHAPALNALEFLAPADHMKVIAEVKRASPSRGDLAAIPEPHDLALRYEAGGASTISVLTEQRKFKGSLDDLRSVRSHVQIPVLRKDFIGNPYQVFEARAAGADLVLLIIAALPQKTLEELYALILELGMTPLVEAHSADEVKRGVQLGSQLLGINARDLTNFELDRELFGRVSGDIPKGTIRVAESAVRGVEDVQHYRDAGADVVLVGEALVTHGDPTETVRAFTSVS